MKLLQTATKIVRDQPLNIDERIEQLEKRTSARMHEFEETVDLFKDLVIKMHDEREKLKVENERLRQRLAERLGGVAAKAAAPLKKATDEFVELAFSDFLDAPPAEKVVEKQKLEETLDAVGATPLSSADEKERAKARLESIKWMRTKFGLPSKAKKGKMKNAVG